MTDLPEVSDVHRSELVTTDPDVAHRWIAQTYTDRLPTLTAGPDGFRMTVTSVAADRLRVDDLRHTTGARVATAPAERLIVSRLREGRYEVEVHGRSLRCEAGDLAMMDPLQPGNIEWDGVDVEVVALDLDTARRVAGGLVGLAPEHVSFELSAPLDATRAGHWITAVDHVRRTLTDEAVASLPLARAEAFRLLATTAMLTFPNTALEAMTDPTRRPEGSTEPASVRRAIEFIEAHAREDIDIVQIADAARLGPRGLQHAFRKHRGQTPIEYLRVVRMEGAHRDLEAADPTQGDTVARVAAGWGFTHPGRFSIEYQRRYDRPPSRTLRG